MLKNYFTTAWRNLRKNKIFSFINIFGLAIGMAACLLILQYVSFQLSYDQFNKNVNDIYRVYNDRYQNGKLIQHGTITYSAIGKAMQDDYPEVINHTRVEPWGKVIISQSNFKKIGEQEVLAVDNSFLSMFSYPMIAGDPKTALKEPYSVVLTASSAKKIFGTKENDLASLIGSTIITGKDSMPYKITAIFKDVPENSHLQFDILASYVTMLAGKNPWKEADYDFKDSDFWHYVQLKHGTNYKALEAKFPAFSEKHFQGNKISGSVEKFYLQPLAKAHLYSDFEYEIANTDSATVAWGMLIIALFIIVIAWVNYINLSTAKSVERAKEVGVRKVSGATRQQLIKQFLTESLLINLSSLVIAFALVYLVQRPFNALIQHQLSLSDLFQKSEINYIITGSFMALILGGIFVSAFYPAFVLSSFQPVVVLKGKFNASKKGIVLRKALVIGQFAITVALIIGSFVVYKQIRYVNQQNLGANISQMLVVNPPNFTDWDSTFINKENSFSSELRQIPHVKATASSWNVLGEETGRNFNIRRSDQDATTHFTMRQNATSFGFFDAYQIKFLAGRDFDNSDYNPDFGKLHNIILNEKATKILGFASPQDAIGKTIYRGDHKWDVIGVTADYHQKSLRYAIDGMLFLPAYSNGSRISVRVDAKDVASTVAAIKKTFDKFFPGNLFAYYFLDEKFNEQYKNDELFGKVFGIFASFAIFIACLGLLGLSLFATTQRTKEIGVRKVLGASVSNIVFLLSKDFIRLIFISFVIASPLAWFVMNNWLQNFAYRINISWWIFALAGILAVMVAFVTISFQAIKAAVANPVKSLRTE
ncbi:MAG TPA: ABC transporter permease [Puia sp.]|nr:ABC transporter permease [Puia sp.]